MPLVQMESMEVPNFCTSVITQEPRKRGSALTELSQLLQ